METVIGWDGRYLTRREIEALHAVAPSTADEPGEDDEDDEDTPGPDQ